MRGSVSVQVEFAEVTEAIAELNYWRGQMWRLPQAVRDRITALNALRPADLFRSLDDRRIVTIELTPLMRALIGTLRAQCR